MRLRIEDGYTLEGVTEETACPDRITGDPLYTDLPAVHFRYRPALPEALAEWRYARSRVTSGKAELDANVTLVVGHLVSWDVEGASGDNLPITAETVRKIPDPILDQIVTKIITWAPKAVAVAGNSPAG